METINERIKTLVVNLGFSSNDKFDQVIGRSRSTTSNITGPRQVKPGYEYLESIKRVFPQVSGDWLLDGNDEMFFPDNKMKKEYIERLEKELEIERRRANRYEKMIDMANLNFQPLSKKAPVIKFYPDFHRILAKVG